MSLAYYNDNFNKYLDQLPAPLLDTLVSLETKLQVKRVYIGYGLIGLTAIWLAFGFGAEIVCNLIGFAYPAYKSIHALETKQIDDDKQWLMYWIVFAVFSLVEFFSDIFIGWLPFYWLAKCAFLIWCMSPLQGATILYHRLVKPYFLKHHPTIDNMINNTKTGLFSTLAAAAADAQDFRATADAKK